MGKDILFINAYYVLSLLGSFSFAAKHGLWGRVSYHRMEASSNIGILILFITVPSKPERVLDRSSQYSGNEY